MNFVSSVLFGSEGTYHLGDITVKFEKSRHQAYPFGTSTPLHVLADACLNSRVFKCLTLGIPHTFIHEMGHAVRFRLLGRKPIVTILTNSCSGFTCETEEYYRPWYFLFLFKRAVWRPPLSPFQSSTVSAAGPLINMAVSSCQLVASIAFKTQLTWPVSTTLAGGALIWMTGELLYAVTSVCRRDSGDYSQIYSDGKVNFMIASALLVGEYVLGIIGAQRFVANSNII